MTYIPQPVPESATHYSKTNGCFYRIRGNAVEIYRNEKCWGGSLMTVSEVRRLDTFVPVPQQKQPAEQPAWAKNALPPVGTICKFVGDTDVKGLWHRDLEHGADVEIIAHFKIGDTPVAAFVFDKYSARYVQQGIARVFAPITQTELEERAAKDDMQSVIDNRGKLSVVDALFAAGYKKGA